MGSYLASSGNGRNGTEEGWERDAELGGGEYLFSGRPLHLSSPRGSSEDPRCPLWAVWVTLITGTVTGSSGPHGVIALPLPLQSLPPTHESPGLTTTPVLPETPEGGGHQTLDAELRQEEPWPLRKEKAGGWVNR